MYFSNDSLWEDFEAEKINTQDIFYHANKLSRGERKKFITRTRERLLIKSV